MTTRKPKPAEDSEEELLQQWDFLDRLVERQASQLRAGIQDSEEADEPAPAGAEVAGLRQELDRLRGVLHTAEAARAAAEAARADAEAARAAAEAARAAAEAEARRSRDALITLTATQQEHHLEEQALRQRDRALEREVAGWRGRAESADRELASRDGQVRAVVADLNQRREEAEAARQRAERELADAITSLHGARLEIEALHEQLSEDQHGFWRFGRH